MMTLESGQEASRTDSKWTAKSSELMQSDSRFLMEYDKLLNGVKKAWGCKQYIVNPFQFLCPVCGELKVMSKMDQPKEAQQHIKDMHQDSTVGKAALERLKAWKTNNFITDEQLDDVAQINFENLP